MGAVALSSGDLTAAISAAGTSVAGVGGTVSGNAGWFILIGAVGLIVGIFAFIKYRLSRLGR